jgi:hypothetical protein
LKDVRHCDYLAKMKKVALQGLQASDFKRSEAAKVDGAAERPLPGALS